MTNQTMKDKTPQMRDPQPSGPTGEQPKLGFSGFASIEAKAMSGCGRTGTTTCGIRDKAG